MRNQASLDAIISIFMILTVCAIVGSIFIQNKLEVDDYAENFGARDACWSIRNSMISARKPGLSVRIELPDKLGGEDYYVQFVGDYLDIGTKKGFGCLLPSVVYNSTGSTNFTTYSKTLVIRNMDGRMIV